MKTWILLVMLVFISIGSFVYDKVKSLDESEIEALKMKIFLYVYPECEKCKECLMKGDCGGE